MVASLQYGITAMCAIASVAASPTNHDIPRSAAALSAPNGRKAGSAGGRAVPFWKDHLGWWYDWTPKPSGHDKDGVLGVSMLWGSGNNGDQDAKRLKDFKDLKETPKYLLGFNEPDCSARDVSSHISVKDAVPLWNKYIVPEANNGSIVGSPSMCTQKDESWLNDFNKQALDKSWDFTAIHVYKLNMTGVQADIDHYWNKYKKPIWVTEFGCVDDQNGFKACTDQKVINQWIRDAVDLFEKNEHILAYAYTDGGGLGKAWLPTNNDGTTLSESGKTYLDAISKYH
ncbi:hypothetical protein VHEMI07012 [[Torrubiella] hemipterigena]|uniref:Asl1-like glycosyl hydrolase catalytic domain-containing protein n=1 Tax=[Torrubiella] hemipterigena TaxID=1531966 RepID=A0A0A1TKI1_9HYPO|nr:hypothetical protein VHEMI07012 [[Torrubiella] hemipterigena]